MDMLEKINGFVWGNGLVFLLISVGIIYTFKLGFIQLKLPVLLVKNRNSGNSGLSQLKTVCMSLGTAMGTGNITGTATALVAGGAGAVFWLWISAFLGMAIVYAENILSAKYSDRYVKGPMAYLAKGLGSPFMAWIFALFCVLASFGMGSMVQINTFVKSFENIGNIHYISARIKFISAVSVFVIVWLITRGGGKSIGTTASYMLPVASVAYMIVCISVIFVFRENIMNIIERIFTEAFSFRSAVGGGAGYAVSVGIRRGIFSNEAGLGSSPILHSAAGDTDPHTQGLWSMFEVFFDTIVCCTLTALMILCGSENFSVYEAVSSVLGGFSGIFISAETGIFALCTVIGWYYCGNTAFLHISGGRFEKYFCVLYAVSSASGALFSAESVWTLSDIFNGLMIIPNLLGLILLMGKVRKNSV
ncbi:MAG: amino acid carrier protein [Ruminococcus sp.]|nr:amino acid carrier protein [Ruminococcus sp.]MDE7225396.1 amino acid carrier protein [Ruminococcus sp.]